MDRMAFTLLGIAIVLLSFGHCPAIGQDGQAQPPKTGAQERQQGQHPDSAAQDRSPAEQKCLELLQQVSEALAKRPKFELKLTNRVVVNSITPNETKGSTRQTVQLTLKSERTAALVRTQLIVNVAEEKPDFVIDWKNGLLVRSFLPEKIYSQSTTKDLRNELRQCQFTAENLAAAHADFLLQPDLVDHVRLQIVHLTDVSEAGGPPHFHLELTDGRVMELWFDTREGLTLPVKMESHRVTPIDENQKMEVVTVGSLNWNLSPDEMNWFELPALDQLRRVDDLRDDMLGADSTHPVGQKVPETLVLDIEGKPIDLPKELAADSNPTLLYFWATWAAPSIREMEGVQQFAKDLENSGIRIHPVNVSESVETIKQFVEATKVPFPVWRDTEGKLSAKLGISQLPAVAIIVNGKVATILESVGATDRDEIREILQRLQDNK